jgi:hypothetical protein
MGDDWGAEGLGGLGGELEARRSQSLENLCCGSRVSRGRLRDLSKVLSYMGGDLATSEQATRGATKSRYVAAGGGRAKQFGKEGVGAFLIVHPRVMGSKARL